MAQIRNLQNNVNSLSGSSPGATHVPSQPLIVPSPRGMLSARDFYDPESGSSSGTTHVSDQVSTIYEFHDLTTLRFWIAAKFTDLYGYCFKRV